MKEILDKLKGMDKKQLSEAVKQAKAYADTPQGKELVEIENLIKYLKEE